MADEGIRSKQVTVLLSHHNCAHLLERAVESIRAQSHQDWTLVVVDDASDAMDGVLAVRRKIIDRRIKWLSTSANAGQFRIYNRVLPSVTSQYFMLHDADDWSAPDRMATLLEEVERTGADLIGSWVQIVDTRERPTSRRCPPEDVNRALRFYRRGGVIVGPTLLGRTAFVRALGGFDGATRIGGDTELICRAVFHGRVRNYPGVLYFQTQRPGSLTNNAETGFSSEQRRRYATALNKRFRGHLFRRWLGLGPSLEHLRSRPNDLDFELASF